MRFFADILDELLDAMDMSICVDTVTDLGDDIWRLNICSCGSTLHAATDRILTNPSGVEYTIISVVHDVSVTIESETTPVVGNWTLPRPAYRHGTPMTVSAEISKSQSDINRFPLVWILEVTSEERSTLYDELSNIEMTPDSRIYFLDFADFRSGTSDTLYDNPVKPMGNLADRLISEGNRLGYWDKPTRATYFPWSKFGLNYTNPKTADRYSSLSSLVGDHVGGVELRLTVPIYKN